MATYDQDLLTSALAGLALAGDGAVIGVTLAITAIRTWIKFHSKSSALKAIRDAPAVRISDLRSLLCDEGDPPDPISGKLVVLRGSVQAKSSVAGNWKSFRDSLLVSPGSGDKGVILQKTQTCLYTEWRDLFGWSSDLLAFLAHPLKKEVVTSFKSVPFVLIEDGHSGSSYVSVNLADSSHPLPLTIVHHELRPVRASPSTIIQAILGHGYPVGLLDEEKILPPGKEITAVGLSSLHDDVPHIKSCQNLPYFLTELTKDQLVVNITRDTKILFWSGMFLSIVSIGILTYAAVRNWRRLKGWRSRRLPSEEQGNPPPETSADEESGDVPDGELCIICLLRRRRSAFIPCGHMVCCALCAAIVERDMNPKCPVCRQSIRNSLRIYDS